MNSLFIRPICSYCARQSHELSRDEMLFQKNETGLKLDCGHYLHDRCDKILKRTTFCHQPRCKQLIGDNYSVVWIRSNREINLSEVPEENREEPTPEQNAVFLRDQCLKLYDLSSLSTYAQILQMDSQEQRRFVRLSSNPDFANEMTGEIFEKFEVGSRLCKFCSFIFFSWLFSSYSKLPSN